MIDSILLNNYFKSVIYRTVNRNNQILGCWVTELNLSSVTQHSNPLEFGRRHRERVPYAFLAMCGFKREAKKNPIQITYLNIDDMIN